MIRIIFSVCLLLIVQSIVAQEIDVDKKSGLVKVNGQESFYLVKKNKVLVTYDISLQNLEKQELAYFATKKVEDLPPLERGSRVGCYMQVTFSETANSARLYPDAFSGIKYIAKQVVNGNLVKNQKIDAKAERAFVISHEGKILKEPELVQININTNPTPSSKPAEITIKGNNIYNSDELVGSFRQTLNDGITTVSVYNKNDNKIAFAMHMEGNAEADWNVTLMADLKKYQFLYNPSNPLEKLFRFLAEKGLL